MIEQESFTTHFEKFPEERDEIVVGPGLRIYSQRSIPDTLDDIELLKEEYPEMFTTDKNGKTICTNRDWLIEQIKPTEIESLLFDISSAIEVRPVKEPSTFDGRRLISTITKPRVTKTTEDNQDGKTKIGRNFRKIIDEEYAISISPSFMKVNFHAKDFEEIENTNLFLQNEYPHMFKEISICGRQTKVCTDRDWYLNILSEKDS